MTWDDFDRWSPVSLRGAANQLVASGLLPETEATVRVAEQLAEQLPAGIATPLHRLWTVRSPEGPLVGHLWMRVRPALHEVEAFVLDVEILPGLRGRGWGRSAMLAAELAARSEGASVVRLNVYGHNAAGIGLYDALGYGVVGATLLRDVPATSPGPPPVQGPVDLRPVEPQDAVGPGPRLWRAFDGADPVAEVWLRLARRSDGRHAFVQELHVHDPDRLPEVVLAVEQVCRGLDVRSMTVSVPESLPAYPAPLPVLVERCGFRVAAQTMAKTV